LVKLTWVYSGFFFYFFYCILVFLLGHHFDIIFLSWSHIASCWFIKLLRVDSSFLFRRYIFWCFFNLWHEFIMPWILQFPFVFLFADSFNLISWILFLVNLILIISNYCHPYIFFRVEKSLARPPHSIHTG